MLFSELPVNHFFKFTKGRTIFYKISARKVFNTSDRTVDLYLKHGEVEDLELTYPGVSIMTFGELPLNHYFQFIGKGTEVSTVFRKVAACSIRTLGDPTPSVYRKKDALVLRLGEDISDFVPPILVGTTQAPIAH